MMNRCITCGKIVTRPKAQNAIERDGHTYLVCCPLCEKEFDRAPDHYIAVARSLLGDFAVDTYSEGSSSHVNGEKASKNTAELVHMIRNLTDSFEALERSNKDLRKHFNQISDNGGLEGLRNALSAHNKMMDSLQDRMAVHSGVCRFVLSVAESAAEPIKATSD